MALRKSIVAGLLIAIIPAIYVRIARCVDEVRATPARNAAIAPARAV